MTDFNYTTIFTKEELGHISTLFKLVEVGYPDFKLNDELLMKIESMMDNYLTICPKCNNQRVSDGVCLVIGCDYRE